MKRNGSTRAVFIDASADATRSPSTPASRKLRRLRSNARAPSLFSRSRRSHASRFPSPCDAESATSHVSGVASSPAIKRFHNAACASSLGLACARKSTSRRRMAPARSYFASWYSSNLVKGLAAAFTKFDEYQLAKYDRAGAIRLRDVLFLAHAKPKDEAQAALWKRLIAGELATPDTWEVALSASQGEGKREAWERLLRENKLGALALLRNLRNFREAGVDGDLVASALASMKTARVLPFRFIAAARYAPQ